MGALNNRIQSVQDDGSKTRNQKKLEIRAIRAEAYEKILDKSLPYIIQLGGGREITFVQFAMSSNNLVHFDVENRVGGVLQPPRLGQGQFTDKLGTQRTFLNHWRVLNPPLLVNDPAGNISRVARDIDGNDIIVNRREDVAGAGAELVERAGYFQ